MDPLDYLFTRPPGSAVAALTQGGTAFLCREDRKTLRTLPMPCPVAIRLHAWEISGVVACVFLARLDDRDNSTWETWLNAHDEYGRRMLNSLAIQPSIDVQLWVVRGEKPARALRSPNLLKLAAVDVLAKADQLGAWPMAAFDSARAMLERQYPSVAILWSQDE